MMSYSALKTIHLLSMVLLFGVGLGSAYFKWRADKGSNIAHIAETNRQVVVADWIFTLPTIIIQPVTGLLLADQLGLTWTTPWLLASITLYCIAGFCWLPVVVLQIRIRNLSVQALSFQTALPDQYIRYAKIWFWLGVPAFMAILSIMYLMVNKPF